MTERRHAMYYQRRQFDKLNARRNSTRPPGDYILRCYASSTGKELARQFGVTQWTIMGWVREARKM